MLTHQYNGAIKIVSWEGTTLASGGDLAAKRGPKFIDNVKSALKKLRSLRTGDKLIREITESGKTCTIFCAQDGKDGCAQTDPTPSTLELMNATTISFRPRRKNLPLGLMDRTSIARTTDNPHGKSKAELYYEKQFTTMHGGKETRKDSSYQLDAIMERARRKYWDPWKVASQLTGKSIQELGRMAYGELAIDNNTYYKICVYFYEFLEPGPGCNTQVRLVFDVGLEGSGGSTNYKRDSTAVRADIMLGHELIHAWRMMKGRRIVLSGWEEEAMTVGLSFAAGWEITENRLRQEAGHPRRNTYGGAVDVSSAWALGWKSSHNQ